MQEERTYGLVTLVDLVQTQFQTQRTHVKVVVRESISIHSRSMNVQSVPIL